MKISSHIPPSIIVYLHFLLSEVGDGAIMRKTNFADNSRSYIFLELKSINLLHLVGGLQLAAKALYKYRPQPPEFKEPLLEIIQQTEMKVEPTPL